MRDFIRFICTLFGLFIWLFFSQGFCSVNFKTLIRQRERERKLNRFNFIRFAIENEEKAQAINLLLFNLIEFLSKKKKTHRKWVCGTFWYGCCWSIFPLLPPLPDKCREKQPFTIGQRRIMTIHLFDALLSGVFVIQMDIVGKCACVRASNVAI